MTEEEMYQKADVIVQENFKGLEDIQYDIDVLPDWFRELIKTCMVEFVKEVRGDYRGLNDLPGVDNSKIIPSPLRRVRQDKDGPSD